MSAEPLKAPRALIGRKHVSLLATIAVFVLLYGAGCIHFDGFAKPGVFINLLGDNAFLGVAALGMTFVILSGGIDLSVGSVVGCTSIMIATLVGPHHLHPLAAIALLLAGGTALGAGMGALIRWFELPPFLVTLAGMFLARGLGLVTSMESVGIDAPFYKQMAGAQIPLPGGFTLPPWAAIFLALFVVCLLLAAYTRFGRNTYAVGGSETSALLMGLPCGATKVWVYAFSGFCSALAGVTYTLYTLSGDARAGMGLELDAIAAVVIGGTLLSGGVGHVAGTLMGVFILGTIQTILSFQGTLSSWWTRIAIGVLLLVFILLQRLLQSRAGKT